MEKVIKSAKKVHVVFAFKNIKSSNTVMKYKAVHGAWRVTSQA